MSARATHLKAATENVSVTTIERKQMSNKTNFKRIALAVVAALGLGVLASGPSSAVTSSETLTLGSATATGSIGDSVTVTVTSSFNATAATDTILVSANLASKPAASALTTGTVDGTNSGFVALSDSLNVTYRQSDGSAYVVGTTAQAAAVKAQAADVVGQSYTGNYRFTTHVFDAVGTYTYNVYSVVGSAGNGVAGTLSKLTTFTVTVASTNLAPDATDSTAYITGNNVPFAANNGDSTLVVAAGTTASTRTAVGYINWLQRNSDSKTTVGAITPKTVGESVTATIAGAGLLVAGGTACTDASANVSRVVAYYESVTVCSDGRAGTATVTLTTPTMKTWTSKSLTFFSSTPASLTATLPTGGGRVETGTALTGAIRVVPKDSAGNNISSLGAGFGMFMYSSDTALVNVFGTACNANYDAVSQAYNTCDLTAAQVRGASGTVTITIRDSSTVAASTVASAPVTFTLVGKAEIAKIEFEKRTYNTGERAYIFVTVSDTKNVGIVNQTVQGVFASGGITSLCTLGSVTGGGSITDTALTFSTTTSAAYASGKIRYEVTLPSNAGSCGIHATGGLGLQASGRVQVADTITVIDPATDAAESALDAAQEATDAAIAATDAAILAQEAADEAASAAVAAQETAQAAVDAVTALSAEVTKLVAQLATLQKLLNRVAKRVGVKL